MKTHVIFFDEDRYRRHETRKLLHDGTYPITLAVSFFKLDTESIKKQIKFWIEVEDDPQFVQDCHRSLSNFNNVINLLEKQKLILLGDKPNSHLEYEMLLAHKRRNDEIIRRNNELVA